MAFIKITVLGILIAIIGRYLFYAVFPSDFYEVAHNHEPGKCLYVSDVYQGAEDIQVTDDGIVIVSSGLNWLRKQSPYYDRLQGKLKVIDLNAALASGGAPVAKELVLPSGFDASTFNPHGLSAWPLRSEKQSSTDGSNKPQKLYHIFVANHVKNSSSDAVEVFEFDATSQKITRHVRSITGPNIKHVNDIAAVGKDRFFFTNDFAGPTDLIRTIESYSALPTGSVGYYNGENATLLAHSLMIPNGIALSHDYKHLYVIETMRKSLNVYYISTTGPNPAAVPTLRWVATHHFGSIGDNVLVDADGDLWIGAHPVTWLLVKAMADPTRGRAPSQIIRLRLPVNPSAQPWTSEIYADDGSKLSASTVALYYKKHILIGTINDKAMWCECTIEQCLVKNDMSLAGNSGSTTAASASKKTPVK